MLPEQEIRQASDYDDFYIATKSEAVEQVETAKLVIDLIERYLAERFAQEKEFGGFAPFVDTNGKR